MAEVPWCPTCLVVCVAEEPEVKAVDVKSQLANGSRGKRSRGDHMLHSGVTTVIPPAVPSPWQE